MASASNAAGLKRPGSSSPYPHSLLVNVLTVKCRNAVVEFMPAHLAGRGNGAIGARPWGRFGRRALLEGASQSGAASRNDKATAGKQHLLLRFRLDLCAAL